MIPHGETLPWTEAFRPKSLGELVGNREQVQALYEWIRAWQTGTSHEGAALVVGPPGVGKTSAVYAIANTIGAELVEFNASDQRNRATIERNVWRAATQQTLDGAMRVILLDEVDGLSGTRDRGGVAAILKVVQVAVHPIVMTANDPRSPRIKDLKKVCRVFTFEPLGRAEVAAVVKSIAAAEGVDIDDGTAKYIAARSGGDLRAAISDLEVLVRSGTDTSDMRTWMRDRERGLVDGLKALFMGVDFASARRVLSETDIDHDQLVLWLEENMHLHLSTAEELDWGMEALSLADMSLGRIWLTNNWSLLSYVYDLAGAGVASGRMTTPYRNKTYREPSWPLLVWRGSRTRNKRSGLFARLAKYTRVSQGRVGRVAYEGLEKIVERNPDVERRIAERFD